MPLDQIAGGGCATSPLLSAARQDVAAGGTGRAGLDLCHVVPSRAECADWCNLFEFCHPKRKSGWSTPSPAPPQRSPPRPP
jgi:hypothetical protein